MSSDAEKSNGAAGAEHSLVDRIELVYDRATGQLAVQGQVVNADVALAMCNQAARHFETQLRIAAAMNERARQVGQAQLAQLRDSLGNLRS